MQKTSDFCCQHPFITWHLAHRIADDAERLSRPVKWSGVEIAAASRPSRAHDRIRIFAGDRDAVTAEGAGAEPENRHSEARAPQRACLETRHSASLVSCHYLILSRIAKKLPWY